MNDLQFAFLGEDDFLSAMQGPCKKWREEHVREGYFESFDGGKLHYYHAAPENPKACLTVVPRFDYVFEQRLGDVHYQTKGGVLFRGKQKGGADLWQILWTILIGGGVSVLPRIPSTKWTT